MKTIHHVALSLSIPILLLGSGCSVVPARIAHTAEARYSVEDPQFARTMGSLMGAALVGGNSCEPLVNGDEIFPAMLAAIRGAQETINLETYIYWAGEVGDEFAEALSERARAGVEVHVLIDWYGSARLGAKDLLRDDIKKMKKAGVEIEEYHPLAWYNLDRFNHRTHRKLLIVDGRIGFTGGVGIADEWSGDGEDPKHWRDSHFRFEGPVVAQMQAVFLDNWMKTRDEVLHGPEYFPALESRGDLLCQTFNSSPNRGSEDVGLMYLLSITAAKKSILISAAYFVPDEVTIKALLDARKRGVEIRIVLPGDNMDEKIVSHASRTVWEDLLKAGVEIYEYQPTMYHCKIMIVDGMWTSVGSTNFDNRSFRLNDEVNVNILSAPFGAKMSEQFERDIAQSRRVTLEGHEGRSLGDRATESLAVPLKSQL